MTRRTDVDGLRAVAILLVLVFHCFPAALPGGFVGVDVFFVISGYLITNIMRGEFARGTFSIAQFYLRRARRILPALFAVVLATAGVSLFILFEPERRSLGKHILSALRFGSNFTLMGEAGYFDTSSELKPLLHLWSLAIEEQFYLFLPLVMWLAGRRERVWIYALLAASLALNVAGYLHDPSRLFYQPLVRYWEPFAGAALAWDRRGPRRWANLAAAAGLGLILLAAAGAGSPAAYPNGFALAVVIGTLLLLANAPGTSVGRALGHRAARFVGAISYPLYLWHWPLLAFARYVFGIPLAFAPAAAVFALSFGLAALTHYGVEKPFGRWPTRRQLSVLGGTAVLLVVVGQILNFNLRGLHPFPVSMRLGAAGAADVARGCGVDGPAEATLEFCAHDRREPATRAVWGDSKSNAIFPALVARSAPGERWVVVGRSACAPVVGTRRVFQARNDDDCARAIGAGLARLVGDPAISFVLIAVANRVLFREYAYEPAPATRGLADAVAALTRAGKRVGLLIDNPTLRGPDLCVARPGDGGRVKPGCTQTLGAYRAELSSFLAMTEDWRRTKPEVAIIDPTEDLCDVAAQECAVLREGQSRYSYGDHLSDFGAAPVAARILNVIRALPAK